MNFLLDSDSLDHILTGNAAIAEKLRRHADLTYLSSIAAAEPLRGVLSAIAKTEAHGFKATALLNSEVAHNYLMTRIYGLSQFRIMPFDARSDELFRGLGNVVRQIGPNDCRIAATAMAHEMTVVTCNIGDFQRITEKANWPALSLVDWTVP